MIITDYDICLDITENSIEVTKIYSKEDEYENEDIYTIDSIRSIKQILKHSIDFAHFTDQHTKIYLKNDFLILEYITGSCISNCPYYRIKEKYKIENGKFIYINKS